MPANQEMNFESQLFFFFLTGCVYVNSENTNNNLFTY